MKKFVFVLLFINSLVFSLDNTHPFAPLEGAWILDQII